MNEENLNLDDYEELDVDALSMENSDIERVDISKLKGPNLATERLNPNEFGASNSRRRIYRERKPGVFEGSNFKDDPLGKNIQPFDESYLGVPEKLGIDTTGYRLPKEERHKGKQVDFKGLYNKYYSASDFRFYIGDILIDKASGIGLNESLSSVPLYTIGNSRFEFLSRGNNIVHGFISINKSTKDYLSRILSHHEGDLGGVKFKSLSPYEQMQLTSAELEKYKAQEKKFLEKKVSAHSVLDWSDFNLFNIDMVYDNSDPTHISEIHRARISEVRIVGYEHGIDISGDGQLIDGYKFIAKEFIQNIG